MNDRRDDRSHVPGYDYRCRPAPRPPYRLENDPCYDPRREYGPGLPFCSPEHEAYELLRLAEEKVAEWIRKAEHEAMKVRGLLRHGNR